MATGLLLLLVRSSVLYSEPSPVEVLKHISFGSKLVTVTVPNKFISKLAVPKFELHILLMHIHPGHT